LEKEKSRGGGKSRFYHLFSYPINSELQRRKKGKEEKALVRGKGGGQGPSVKTTLLYSILSRTGGKGGKRPGTGGKREEKKKGFRHHCRDDDLHGLQLQVREGGKKKSE